MTALQSVIRSRLLPALIACVAFAGCELSGPAGSDGDADRGVDSIPIRAAEINRHGAFVQSDLTIRSRGVAVPVTWVTPSTAATSASLPLAILIHGHGGTRDEAGGFTRLAAELAEAGIATIRMDFPGSGDSAEPFYRNNLRNMLADIRAARKFAFRQANIDASRVALVGFSMGGRLAAMLSAEDGGIDAMVLWAPAVENGADGMVAMLGGPDAYAASRAQAQREGFAPFTTSWGQLQQLGPEWFEDMENSRPMDALETYRGALLIVHGSADNVVPVSLSKRAATLAIRAQPVELHIIDGADHGFGLFADPDLYSQELIEVTVRFLDSQL